ncbi:hypothetical protein EA462_15890 [Natrarchaeobius halalkaliphilus]|uniref:DUF7511 domain-containing protein n=1 Tax=Natrarchaeobius halalkaliphilus TaxID=1679091 RepID=A0A3N6LKT6_9EURY|nr:hypothetical protein [Natrarchaeobius halalkaliphilus]RQG87108.1 hypothetical protein EA462_15890 [Natrarchaeobius halalkaliphilus]
MTVNEAPVPENGQFGDAQLELLTDDEEVWTVVPVDARGDQRVSEWLSIDSSGLRDLEEWR